MKKLNWLHKFNVIQEKKVKEEVKTTNEKGEEVITKREVTKRVPVMFGMRKPTRKLYEQGELYYGVKLSDGVKAGLLTKPLLAKRYKNDGGPLSDTEKKKYAELYVEFLKSQNDLEKLKLNLDNMDLDEREVIATEIVTKLTAIKEEIVEYELLQTSLFDQTAEVRAKNQTIMWWVLQLAYQKTDVLDEFTPLFGDEEDVESRLKIYDSLEEESSPFWTEVIKKFAYFVTYWYTNGISAEEDFKNIELMYKRDNGVEDNEIAESVEEDKKEESPKQQESNKEESLVETKPE